VRSPSKSGGVAGQTLCFMVGDRTSGSIGGVVIIGSDGVREINKLSFCWIIASLVTISAKACSRDVSRCSASISSRGSEIGEVISGGKSEGLVVRERTESVESEGGLQNQAMVG
jgi:hypothetical protein